MLTCTQPGAWRSSRLVLVAMCAVLGSSCADGTGLELVDGGPADLGSIDGGAPAPDGGQGPSDDAAVEDGGVERTVANFIADYGPAECAAIERCDLFGGCYEGGFLFGPELQFGFDQNRLQFDPVAAEACLAELQTFPCGELLPRFEWNFLFGLLLELPACRRVFIGLVPLGGACGHPGECQGGYETTGCQQEPYTCTGTCVALAAEGQACVPDENGFWESPFACGLFAGQYCDPTTEKCVAFTPDGAACRTDQECRLGLACLNRRCAAAPEHVEAGERCLGDFACTPPLRCVLSAGGIAVCGLPTPLGDPCVREYADVCVDGADCLDFGDGRRCRAPSPAGGACDRRGEGCARGLWCDPATTTPTCRPAPEVNEPCNNDTGPYCRWGLYCGANGTCLPTVGRGEACTVPDECWDETWSATCKEGVCWDYGQCQ